MTILVYAWVSKLDRGTSLEQTLAYLDALGTHTVIMLQPPSPAAGNFAPRMAGQLRRPEYDRAKREATNASVRSIAARHRGTIVIDPAPLFLDGKGTVVVASPGGPPLFYDYAHLSRYGASRVAPLIEGGVAAARQAASRTR